MSEDEYGYNKPSPLSEKEQAEERERRRLHEELSRAREKTFASLGKDMAKEIAGKCEKEFGNPKPAYFVGFDKMQVNACVKGASIGLESAGISLPYIVARGTK